MSQNSPHLNLPYIQPAQAQKHVTHNEAIELLDMIVQLTVQGFDAQTPTTSPTEGETWALGAAPTGAWDTQGGQLATWRGGGWLFVTPQTGWRAYGVSEMQIRVYDGTNWASTAGTPVLENLPGLGINATSDATNKLAVSSDATLLNHAGQGHQVKVNKAAATDTASLLYQSGFSGRAEIGLAGDDDFTIKTSPDGITFKETVRIDNIFGTVFLPQGKITPSRDAIPNLLSDSGRFLGDTSNGLLTANYAAPTYLSARPGVTIAQYGKFMHNNTSHGGTAGVLEPDVDTLVSKIRGADSKRYGSEWAVLSIFQNTATGSSYDAFGDTFELSIISSSVPIPKITTSGFYLKMVSGKGLVLPQGTPVVECTLDGVDVGSTLMPRNVVTPSDGWIWCQMTQGSYAGLGYNHLMLSLRMTVNAQCLYALPKVIGGHADLAGMEIMPNSNIYG